MSVSPREESSTRIFAQISIYLFINFFVHSPPDPIRSEVFQYHPNYPETYRPTRRGGNAPLLFTALVMRKLFPNRRLTLPTTDCFNFVFLGLVLVLQKRNLYSVERLAAFYIHIAQSAPTTPPRVCVCVCVCACLRA